MLTALLLLAQWLDHPDKNIPRAKDGKPALTAKAPKARDGKPDLSGIWLPDNTPGVKGTNGEGLPGHFISVTFGMKNEDVPFTPEAGAAFRQRLRDNGKGDPTATCHPIGAPGVDTLSPLQVATRTRRREKCGARRQRVDQPPR